MDFFFFYKSNCQNKKPQIQKYLFLGKVKNNDIKKELGKENLSTVYNYRTSAFLES